MTARPTMNAGKSCLKRILVITGSGISADSGIPTFRDANGYWRDRELMRLATPEAFHEDPGLIWKWYSERRSTILNAAPNAAHHALVELQKSCTDFLLVTQNVDDLDSRAGMPPEKMVQIHGDIFVSKCRGCGFAVRDTGGHMTKVPACPQCRGYLSPGVVWFGENLSSGNIASVNRFLAEAPCTTVAVVGTTAQFPYIDDWVARARGQAAILIEVNPRPALSMEVDYSFRERASVALPDIVEQLIGSR